MKRARMLKTSAGPDGVLTKGDYAPVAEAEDMVKAKVAEWVDEPGDVPDYDSNSFGGQSVSALSEILTRLGEDVPRIIEPRKVSSAVIATLDELDEKIAEYEAALAAMQAASEKEAKSKTAADAFGDKDPETKQADEKAASKPKTTRSTTRKKKSE